MNENKKKALITGASRGLGRALAEELAARGLEVALVARHRDLLEEVAAGIRRRGGHAHAIAADVGDRKSAGLIAAEAAALMGSVDILVHNASTLGPVPLPHLIDTGPDALEQVFRTTVLGPAELTRAVAGTMAVRGEGVVAFVSSDAAVEAYEGWGAYGASKAAADHLARIWAAELGDSGVRVFSVDPGEMDTEMHAAALPDADPSTLARPADVARALATLLDDPSAAPNGSRVVAAGLQEAS